MVDDLATAAELLNKRHAGTPVYVVGVSMGGAVAMTALARDRLPSVAGTVLVGPAVWGRETMPVGHRILLWIASHTVPWQTVSGRGLDITPSDNIEMLRALGADPLVIKETRIDAIHGLVDLMDTALDAAPTLRSPLLVLYGARDEIIPKEPTTAMLCNLVAPRRVAVYEDGYHMLLRDLQAPVVHRDVTAWIDDPTTPLPSAAEDTTSDLLNCG
jgi:alpha-beta hydrolase superfamily lysophospholipase